MLNRIRNFFYSDDPIVKLVGGLHEPQAESWRELLLANSVSAVVKNMGGGLSYQWGRASTFTADWDIFVKESDLKRACDILGLEYDEP